MATDDLKARLLAEADYCEEMHGLTGAPDVMREAAAAIATLEAQLAVRDALLVDIAAYHRGDGKYHFAHLPSDERGYAMLDAWDAIWEKLEPLATAINRKDEA